MKHNLPESPRTHNDKKKKKKKRHIWNQRRTKNAIYETSDAQKKKHATYETSDAQTKKNCNRGTALHHENMPI